MREPLVTTRLRIIGATFMSLLILSTLLLIASVLVSESLPNRIMLLAVSITMASLCSIPGAVGWFVMHRLRLRTGRAMIVGSMIGGATGALVATPCFLLGWTPAAVLAIAAVFTPAGAVLGALTSALVWWIAYPMSLRLAPAEAFS